MTANNCRLSRFLVRDTLSPLQARVANMVDYQRAEVIYVAKTTLEGGVVLRWAHYRLANGVYSTGLVQEASQ